MMCAAAVEAKCKFVEVIVQMLVADSSLKCASEPTFHQGDDQVRYFQVMGWNSRVRISHIRKRAISRPVVGTYQAPRFHRLFCEGGKAFLGGIWNNSQPDSTDPIGFFVLDRDCDENLSKCPSASFTRFLTAHVGFIHLNDSTKPVTARLNHRPSNFVKPRPCRLVTTQFQHPLDALCTCSVFLANDPPNSAEPHQQRFASSLKDRTGCQRHLILAQTATYQAVAHRPCLDAAATGANKTRRPTEIGKILTTRLLGGKAQFKI